MSSTQMVSCPICSSDDSSYNTDVVEVFGVKIFATWEHCNSCGMDVVVLRIEGKEIYHS